MTLVAYNDGILYADNRMVKEAGERDQFFYPGQKVWVDSGSRLAIAFVGDLPHDKEVPLIMERMFRIARNLLKRDALPANKVKEREKLESQAHDFLENFPGKSDRNWMTIFCVTKHHALMLEPKEDDSFSIHIFHPGVEIARGSGKRAYNLCRQNGLTPERAYEIICKVDHSVGPLASRIVQSEMNEFPPEPVEEVKAEEGAE